MLKYVPFVSSDCHLFLQLLRTGGVMQGGKCQSPDDQPSSNAKIQMPNKAQMPECQTKRRDKRRPYYAVLGLRSGFGKPHLRDLICQGRAQFQISMNSLFEQGENVAWGRGWGQDMQWRLVEIGRDAVEMQWRRNGDTMETIRDSWRLVGMHRRCNRDCWRFVEIGDWGQQRSSNAQIQMTNAHE